MNKSLIIFDLDGTLIDSVPDLTSAVNVMLQAFHAPSATQALVRSWVGNGSKKLVERALTWANLNEHQDAHHAHEWFLAAYADHCCVDTVPYPDVDAGLAQLQAHGYTLAIATNKPIRFVPTILQNLGWTDKFACVLGGDSLPTKKPDPAPLLHICQELGFLPKQSIMVGDSKNDILAGQAAGMTTLALTYGYNYNEPISQSSPDRVFDDFASLTQYLINN